MLIRHNTIVCDLIIIPSTKRRVRRKKLQRKNLNAFVGVKVKGQKRHSFSFKMTILYKV